MQKNKISIFFEKVIINITHRILFYRSIFLWNQKLRSKFGNYCFSQIHKLMNTKNQALYTWVPCIIVVLFCYKFFSDGDFSFTLVKIYNYILDFEQHDRIIWIWIACI